MRDSNKLYVGQTGIIVTFKTYVDKNPHLKPHGFVWNDDARMIYCTLCNRPIGTTPKMNKHAESKKHIQLFKEKNNGRSPPTIPKSKVTKKCKEGTASHILKLSQNNGLAVANALKTRINNIIGQDNIKEESFEDEKTITEEPTIPSGAQNSTEVKQIVLSKIGIKEHPDKQQENFIEQEDCTNVEDRKDKAAAMIQTLCRRYLECLPDKCQLNKAKMLGKLRKLNFNTGKSVMKSMNSRYFWYLKRNEQKERKRSEKEKNIFGETNIMNEQVEKGTGTVEDLFL